MKWRPKNGGVCWSSPPPFWNILENILQRWLQNAATHWSCSNLFELLWASSEGHQVRSSSPNLQPSEVEPYCHTILLTVANIKLSWSFWFAVEVREHNTQGGLNPCIIKKSSSLIKGSKHTLNVVRFPLHCIMTKSCSSHDISINFDENLWHTSTLAASSKSHC